MKCPPLKCRNCGNLLVDPESMRELALLINVFEVRLDAVFKCSKCKAEYVLQVREDKMVWTTIIHPKTQRQKRPAGVQREQAGAGKLER